MKRALILSLLSLLVVAPAFAGKSIVLEPMEPRIDAWGMASVDIKRGIQFFDLRVDVGLPNGAWLLVEISRNDRPTPSEWVGVCKAEIVLGTATCRLNSRQNVSPVFPVKGIAGVMVRYKGQAILKGHF